MNEKTTLKLIKIIMGDSSISDSDKLEAVKKLTDSPQYIPYYPQPCPDQYPLFPYQPTWTGTQTVPNICAGDETQFSPRFKWSQ